MLFAALALLVENLVGYPAVIYSRVGHPIEWIGRLIALLDEQLNTRGGEPQQQTFSGVLAVVVLIIAVGLPAAVVQWLTMSVPYGWVANVMLAVPFLAQKSLRDHVLAVADGLTRDGDLTLARSAVSKIVGRDPSALDESGISKAALESLAENASDGVVAPALWYSIAGLPGLVIYKAINTADSMIGHKSEKYLHFGWAAARLDDLVNLPASRLTGLLFAAAAWITSKPSAQLAWRCMVRDARHHQSPNAGWPEAAMAGALGVRFGGPRSYDGEIVELAWMGEGRSALSGDDIARGLALYDRAIILLPSAFLVLALIL
jgi:adenosylcobinamide-phosphate synthase